MNDFSRTLIFLLMLMFGFCLTTLILAKFKQKSDILSENNSTGTNSSNRIEELQNQLAIRYQASRGALALIQSMSNTASSNNHQSSSQQLLNYWKNTAPIQAWNNLPSTR